MPVVGQWCGKEWQEAFVPQMVEWWKQQIAEGKIKLPILTKEEEQDD